MTQAASEIGTYEVDRSTHFLFEHKVFTLKGARFALTEDGSTPAFHVELGTLVASLPMGTLRAEFGIDRDFAGRRVAGDRRKEPPLRQRDPSG